jgi:hypothetical protein
MISNASEKASATMAAPSALTDGIAYGMRNANFYAFLSGVTSAWSGTITVWGLMPNNMWCQLSPATSVTANPTGTQGTIIYAPSNMVSCKRVYIQFSNPLPAGTPVYWYVGDLRVNG